MSKWRSERHKESNEEALLEENVEGYIRTNKSLRKKKLELDLHKKEKTSTRWKRLMDPPYKTNNIAHKREREKLSIS